MAKGNQAQCRLLFSRHALHRGWWMTLGLVEGTSPGGKLIEPFLRVCEVPFGSGLLGCCRDFVSVIRISKKKRKKKKKHREKITVGRRFNLLLHLLDEAELDSLLGNAVLLPSARDFLHQCFLVIFIGQDLHIY